jgi:biotin-dependent carboxylase-like uncharacterized protein
MLKVIKSGIYSSIQDQGRFGFADLGIPVSGVMDERSANLANTIIGNPLTNAVLEVTFGLAKFQFLSPTIVCVSGADFNPKLNGNQIQLNQLIIVKENDILSFGSPKIGVRCYVAVKNGFQTAVKLGSKSQYINITEQASVQKNDLLYYEPFTNYKTTLNAKLKANNLHFTTNNLSCYKGPEFHLLSQTQQEKLFSTSFTISKDNSRMGYRFNEKIENRLSSILTSSVLPGSVQLTPSGKIIALMKDCQVTGGYPRVLQLTQEAINILAQKSTNQSVKFKLNIV